jgi:hypothetical protein
MHPRVAQKRTIQRTIDGYFAPGSTALRANIAADAGAMPARTPLFTNLTRDIHGETPLSYRLSYDRRMSRTDLYLKVEIDLDEREHPERLASEICRQIRKVYGVRSAEVSNIIERET